MAILLAIVLLHSYAAYSVGAVVLSNTTVPIVDLGYEIYTGYYNQSASLNVFKGCVSLVTRPCLLAVPCVSLSGQRAGFATPHHRLEI